MGAGGGGGTGGAAQFVRGSYKSFKEGIILTVLEIMHQFIRRGSSIFCAWKLRILQGYYYIYVSISIMYGYGRRITFRACIIM